MKVLLAVFALICSLLVAAGVAALWYFSGSLYSEASSLLLLDPSVQVKYHSFEAGMV